MFRSLQTWVLEKALLHFHGLNKYCVHWKQLHLSHCSIMDGAFWGRRKTSLDFSSFIYHWGLSQAAVDNCALVVRKNKSSQMLDQLVLNSGVILQMGAKASYRWYDRKQDNVMWQILHGRELRSFGMPMYNTTLCHN